MKDVHTDPDVRQVLERMTVEQKVGQMFLLAFAGPDPSRAETMIRGHFIGGCYISQENASTAQAACALSRQLQEYSTSSGAAVPLLLGADQEGAWGVVVPESTTGPGNLGLGAAHSSRMTSAMYRVIGRELRAVGYNTLFAPCVDVNSNPRNSIIGMRSFGEDPRAVCRHAKAAVRGASSSGVITTAKHFPGHGDTSLDSHRNIPRVERSRADVERIDLAPFRAAIRAGVDIVMTSHILFPSIDPENPATLSPAILRGVLREQMGFEGVILSDSMNMGAMRKNYGPGDAALRAVRAGVDMIMLAEEHYDHNSSGYEENQLAGIRGILDAVRTGTLAAAVIDDAVSRILHLKKRHGLLSCPLPALDPSVMGHADHRAVETAVSERLVVRVRDSAGAWPVPRTGRIAVVRSAPSSAYGILTATRGIGPNQAEPAFSAFATAFSRERPDVVVHDFEGLAEEGAVEKLARTFDAVIAVTEDYPLPGIDFDTAHQKELVKRLIAALGKKLIVIALRPPYDLAEYPGLPTYICTCSSRPSAARAAARAAAGVLGTRGRLPVSVPDL